ncbi:MAG: hypothetical protein ACK5Q3_00220 [Planctomycetota bacterium]
MSNNNWRKPLVSPAFSLAESLFACFLRAACGVVFITRFGLRLGSLRKMLFYRISILGSSGNFVGRESGILVLSNAVLVLNAPVLSLAQSRVR